MAPSDWIMRGEGNANVVLAYVGPAKELAGAVLRVRKAGSFGHGGHEQDRGGELQAELWDGIFEWSPDAVEREVRYIRDYLSHKLGSDYVHAGVAVPVIDDAAVVLEGHGRHVAAGAPALLLADHTVIATGLTGHTAVGPVVCVEVKPKCGFVAHSPLISRANAIKLQYPRFAMHQFMNHTQKHTPFCRYNPLDLFSEDPARTLRALENLLQEPNNNLRVFKDGELVYGGRPTAPSSTHLGAYSSAPATLSALQNSLSHFATVKDAEAVQVAASAGVGNDAAGAGLAVTAAGRVMRLVQQVLRETGVLKGLLELQKLDRWDIEGILPLYQRLLQPAAGDTFPARGRTDPPYRNAGTDQPTASEAVLPALETNPASMSRQEALVAVRDYLTSATAKDCSVMITLQQVVPAPTEVTSTTTLPAAVVDVSAAVASMLDDEPAAAVPTSLQLPAQALRLLEEPSTGAKFMYKVAFVDLDIKHPSKIPAHFEQDKCIVECVQNDLSGFLKLISQA